MSFSSRVKAKKYPTHTKFLEFLSRPLKKKLGKLSRKDRKSITLIATKRILGQNKNFNKLSMPTSFLKIPKKRIFMIKLGAMILNSNSNNNSMDFQGEEALEDLEAFLVEEVLGDLEASLVEVVLEVFKDIQEADLEVFKGIQEVGLEVFKDIQEADLGDSNKDDQERQKERGKALEEGKMVGIHSVLVASREVILILTFDE